MMSLSRVRTGWVDVFGRRYDVCGSKMRVEVEERLCQMASGSGAGVGMDETSPIERRSVDETKSMVSIV